MTKRAPPQQWDELARLIARRTGLAGLTLSHENLGRAAERACAQGLPRTADELERLVVEGDAHWDTLIDELTVRETYFFRHPEQFQVLRQLVLPELRALLPEHATLRVWSAGCASGEEAYSLTMLFADEGLLERSHVVATDISRDAIERGRAACYREWSFRALDPQLTAHHVRGEGRLRTVNDVLRRRVVFKQLNLATDAYPSLLSDIGAFNLIFCRNVLMFLDAATIAAIAGRLYAALLPGGYVFTGPSDPNLGAYAGFEVQLTPAGLLYRRPLGEGSASQASRQSSLPPPAAALRMDVPTPLPSLELTEATQAGLLAAPTPEPIVLSAPAELAREVREAWNTGGARLALDLCRTALARRDGELELHHLHALLLWELQDFVEAARAMRRVLYLDRGSAIAHFSLGSLLDRLGEANAARRSYLNALACCDKLAPDEALPLGDGICAAGLRGAARQSLARLDAAAASGGRGGST